MKSLVCLVQSHVDAHFAGTIAPDDERAMRAHLSVCEGCRARYRRRLLLAKLDPHALSADVRIAQGLGLRKAPPLLRSMAPPVAALLAVAAAVVLFLPGPQGGDGFSARGGEDGGARALHPEPSPLHVYQVPPKAEGGGGPVPVFDTVRRNAELAFAYENRDQKQYVMIFAVSDLGRVYWFYPEWTNPTDNPRAIAVTADPGLHELPDAVVHRFEGSTLDLHALFLDAPTSVREIEQAAAAAPPASAEGRGGALSVPGGIDHVARFRVAP